MHPADLKHDKASLQQKLERLYTLNRHTTIDLSFRPPYLNLLKAFGNPHLNLPPTIHVAGTNGKGSTIAMLRAILETAGYKVHTYTSPHLKRFNERIVLAGQEIENQALENLIDEALELNNGGELTFFEITTAIAFAAFSRTPADVLLLETGLGGRLDCTNVIESPLATIITNISLDHTEFLGDTVMQIASEKAGIMKPKRPCIIGPQTLHDQKNQIIGALQSHASITGSPTEIHGSSWEFTVKNNSIHYGLKNKTETFNTPNLHGTHQINNFATAITCIKLIQKSLPVHDDAINVASKRIKWPARLQKIIHDTENDQTEIWLDGGHNDTAGIALADQAVQWQIHDPKELHLILGMKSDKSPEAFLRPLSRVTKTITLVPLEGIGAYLTHDTLTRVTDTLNIPTPFKAKDVQSAITQIKTEYGDNIRILICGSLYLADQIPNDA